MEKIKYFLYNPVLFVITKIIRPIPYFDFLFKTGKYQNTINFKFWFEQKVLNKGGNQKAYCYCF